MKKAVLIFSLAITQTVQAQVYGDYHLGAAFNSSSNSSSLVALHIGYEFNEVFTPNGIALIEYDQRALIKGISPVYFGGRIGYGLNTGEVTSVCLWGGRYYRFISGDDKKINYWVPGYGVSFMWKSVIIDISRIEAYQVSFGCHYLFD